MYFSIDEKILKIVCMLIETSRQVIYMNNLSVNLPALYVKLTKTEIRYLISEI